MPGFRAQRASNDRAIGMSRMAPIDIASCWARIERWLGDNVAEVVKSLPRGARPAALARAEKLLQYELPGDLKEYLSIHDGSGGLSLHDDGKFMSVAEILAAWKNNFGAYGDNTTDEWVRPRGPIRKKRFRRKWLPIVDGNGYYLCLDLDPPKGGKKGQVIEYLWEQGRGPTRVVAPSFFQLISKFVKDLEAGKYEVNLNIAGQFGYLSKD
ncbi:MAG: SMI1/KNR4 family protein [Gemmataceae bacterium]